METQREVALYDAAREKEDTKTDSGETLLNAALTRLVGVLESDTASRDQFRRQLQMMAHAGDPNLTAVLAAMSRGDA